MPAAPTHAQVDEELVVEALTFEHDVLPNDEWERVALRLNSLMAQRYLRLALRSEDASEIRAATAAVKLAEDLQQHNDRIEDPAHVSLLALHRQHRVFVTARDLPPAA